MMNVFPAQELSNDKVDNGNDNKIGSCVMKEEKYSLRPRSLRQKTEKGLELKKETSRNLKGQENGKPKQKPPPLSKYRRKTANARERNRMREINVAFETLRKAVPQISGSLNSGNEKLTKITTLRLAMKYIQALRQLLDRTPVAATVAPSSHPDPFPTATIKTTKIPSFCPPNPHSVSLAETFLEDDATDIDVLLSDGESLNFNSDMSESFASPDHPLTSPFSEPSTNDNSIDFCGKQDFSFGDSVDIDFCFPNVLSDSDFCREFLHDHCFDNLSWQR